MLDGRDAPAGGHWTARRWPGRARTDALACGPVGDTHPPGAPGPSTVHGRKGGRPEAARFGGGDQPSCLATGEHRPDCRRHPRGRLALELGRPRRRPARCLGGALAPSPPPVGCENGEAAGLNAVAGRPWSGAAERSAAGGPNDSPRPGRLPRLQLHSRRPPGVQGEGAPGGDRGYICTRADVCSRCPRCFCCRCYQQP